MAASDKLERLMNLTAALLDTDRPLTAEQIGQRVTGYPESKQAFRRAFERDKEDLRELGVPLLVEEIAGRYPPETGYRIDRDAYELPDPGLTPDELAALNLALQAVRLGDEPTGTDRTEALWKLGGVVDPDGAGVPATGPVASVGTDPALVPLFSAVVERRPATFAYRSGAGVAERTVDPWRLDHRRGRWYLTAHDHLRGEERNFRLDRIEGEVRLGPPASFDRPARPEAAGEEQPWRYGEGDTVTATLRVDASQARWATEQLGADAVVGVDPDGTTTYAVPVTSWPAFRSFALGFLDHAELLGPDELRHDLVAWLRDLAGADG